MIDRLLAIAAPHYCCGCGKTGHILCQNCKYDIANDGFSGCIVCGRPSLVGICTSCHTSYDRAWCAGDRIGPLEQLIDAYKFKRAKSASKVLASLLDITLPVLPVDTVVVPVPTVRSHIRQRGYDHAALLAREFARLRGLCVTQCITRKTNVTQRGLNKRDRMNEAKRAFVCNKQLDSAVAYLIIDDVVTTNASLRYSAEAIRSAGATMVWAAVIARQPLDKQG